MLKTRLFVIALAATLMAVMVPASAAPEQAPTLTVSPAWATSETLQSEGVELTGRGLPPQLTVYPRFEQYEVPPEVVGQDGTVSTRIEVPELMEPGTYEVWLEGGQYERLVSTELRVTVLELTATGSTIVGSGFEPGRPVTLSVDGVEQGEAPAGPDGRVEFPSTWAGEHDVTLRSAAGEVAATLTLEATPTPTPEPTPPPAPPVPSVDDIIAQGEDLLDAIRSQREDHIAEQMDRMLDKQREAFGDDHLKQAQLELLRRIETERQAQIQLNLEAQRRAMERAMQSMPQTEREKRMQANQQHQKAVERVERGNADLLAILRSTPRQLGTVPVSADGTATVDLPGDVSGDHHIALIDSQSGIIMAYVPVSLDTQEGALPRVGSGTSPELLALAAALAVSGAVVWSRASSRPRPARRP
ncbi:hypothetical protein [Aeromicrobium phragmitis]|uniref:hypothetical protein n=1 Tax=Aeromicrobium phragmitis TaxID=2478914 RepID=UPI0010622A25|nr:hypothetical protein [Aeromicrobium phragmitis]